MRLNLLAALIATLGLGAAAVGQETSPVGPGRRGWGPGIYDRSTVTTVSGQVEAIEGFVQGRAQGVRLVLKSSDGDADVLLGPVWYLETQDTKVEKGDAVEVTGSKVLFLGKQMIVAQSLKKGESTLTLRDADGVPAWAGPPARDGGPGWRGGPPGWRGGPPWQGGSDSKP